MASKTVSYYNYMYHLAEMVVPYPMMHQMAEELPILYRNNVVFWQPETLPTFESSLPGLFACGESALTSVDAPGRAAGRSEERRRKALSCSHARRSARAGEAEGASWWGLTCSRHRDFPIPPCAAPASTR